MKKYYILCGIGLLFSVVIVGCSDSTIVSDESTKNVDSRSARGVVVFSNQTVSSDEFVAGTEVLLENVTVINRAKLTLQGKQSIVINPPFTVDGGSEIDISCQ